MQYRLINLSKFLVVMLTLFGMAILMSAFFSNANAQSGNRGGTTYCFDKSAGGSGVPVKPNSNGECTPPAQLFSASLSNLGVCVVKTDNGDYITSRPTLDVNGRLAQPPCQTSTGAPSGTYYSFESMGIVVPPIKPPTNTNTPPTNSPGGGGSTTGTGGTASSGPCDPPEAGFHKAGPLCVPNNPFSPNSIANPDNPSPQALAIKIIRVLLYMAAIVAVIMAIIGGYYVMTARGNEAQATTGRKTLINALIGLAIILLAYIIVQIVVNFLTK